MPGEEDAGKAVAPPIIDAVTMPQALIKACSTSGKAFTLNRDYDQVTRKIKGDPTANVPDAALREAFCAYLVAKGSSREVLMGDEAVSLLHPSAGPKDQGKNCDVIGKGTEIVVGEGKGDDVPKAVMEQLPCAVNRLNVRGELRTVSAAIIVSPPPRNFLYPLGGFGGKRGTEREWMVAEDREKFVDLLRECRQRNPPLNPNFVYLLYQQFNNAYNPSGWAVPAFGDRFLFQHTRSGGWGHPQRHILRGTQSALVRIVYAK
jgi:hypothetical protein